MIFKVPFSSNSPWLLGNENVLYLYFGGSNMGV